MATRRTEVAFDNAGADQEFIALAGRTAVLCEELSKSTSLKRFLSKRRKQETIISELNTLLGDIDSALSNLGYRKRTTSFVELRDQITTALKKAG